MSAFFLFPFAFKGAGDRGKAMRLIIIGCEYAGKSTLAAGVRAWAEGALGGLTSSFHDHFVFPDGEASSEEQEQLMVLVPSLKEKYQRYLIHYHFHPDFYSDNDHCLVGFYYSEAVYAPLYYGYGRPGEYSDRARMVRAWDHQVMAAAPDTVLVLTKASPEVIRGPMAAYPERISVLQEKDVELVLQRFDEFYAGSLIRRRFTLDTSTASEEETLAEFVRNMEKHFSPIDRLRMVTRKG